MAWLPHRLLQLRQRPFECLLVQGADLFQREGWQLRFNLRPRSLGIHRPMTEPYRITAQRKACRKGDNRSESLDFHIGLPNGEGGRAASRFMSGTLSAPVRVFLRSFEAFHLDFEPITFDCPSYWGRSAEERELYVPPRCATPAPVNNPRPASNWGCLRFRSDWGWL